MIQFLATANLIVGVQSLFLATHFLFKTKGTKVLNRLMALVTFCLTLILINTYLNIGESNIESDVLQDFANNCMWFVGPALFTYVNYERITINRNYLLKHFLVYPIPLFIDLFFIWPTYQNIIPFVGFTQIGIYLIFAIQTCMKYYNERKSFFSWVLPAISSFAILVLINFFIILFGRLGWVTFPSEILQGLTLVLFIPIYFISYKEMGGETNFGLKQKKYQSTPLSHDKLKLYLKQIEAAMRDQKLFRNKDLDLSKLSSELGIPSKYVSQAINQLKEKSFTDYLAYYRIEEAKLNLVDPTKRHFSIAGIAEESGFSSVSRFNHLFKQSTSLTPSEYQKTGSK